MAQFGKLTGPRVCNAQKKITHAQVNRHRINKKEPIIPATILPDMPMQLSDSAKQLYIKYGTILLDAGVLKQSDGLLLASYSQVSADVLEAFEQNKRLKKEHMESVGYINLERLSPIRLMTLQRQLASELGLSPVMRGRLQVEKEDTVEKEWAILDAAG